MPPKISDESAVLIYIEAGVIVHVYVINYETFFNTSISLAPLRHVKDCLVFSHNQLVVNLTAIKL